MTNSRSIAHRLLVFAALLSTLATAAPGVHATNGLDRGTAARSASQDGEQPAPRAERPAAEASPDDEASAPQSQTLTLTLDEAIQIALISNHELQKTRLNVDNADAQVREAWGQVMPQVSANASYTRNIKTADPFAGSDAGGLFQSLAFMDWLAYNEGARTDADPATTPIDYGDFNDRRMQGLTEAGIQLGGGDNLFAVPNQFVNGISVEQTLYSGSAFAAIKGADRLKNINRLAETRAEQVLVDQVRQAFYTAMLAQEQASVALQSVDRTQATLDEVSRRVTQGVAPKFQRLSSEVELANLQTSYVQTDNQAAIATDNLKLILGVPISQPLRLRGELDVDDLTRYTRVSSEDAFQVAFENRPDLEQAQVAVELYEIDRQITRSQYLPTLTAFANFNYVGNVPGNRTSIVPDPDDPFKFGQRSNGFFSESYWQPSINGGFRLSWDIFNGFQTSARLQQRQVAVAQARLDEERLVQAVQLEVETALRNLRAAQRRIVSQEQNVTRAELNYEYAQARLGEGVASPLEEREASEQLDQSRLNYLLAVHDYLVARSAFETAVGLPMRADEELRLTARDGGDHDQ